jgi:hypothetical protein
MKWMNETESVNETASQCNGGRDESAGGKDQTDEKYVLGHTSSVREKCGVVQAEVIMPYLRNLLAPQIMKVFSWIELEPVMNFRVGGRAKVHNRL